MNARARMPAGAFTNRWRGYFLLPRLGLTPWFAFFRRARFLAFTVRLLTAEQVTGRR